MGFIEFLIIVIVVVLLAALAVYLLGPGAGRAGDRAADHLGGRRADHHCRAAARTRRVRARSADLSRLG